MQAILRQEGNRADHTPGSDVAAGDVVVIGTRLVTVASVDIPANTKGSVAIRGNFDGVKDDSDISNGDPVYWDADGDPVGGTAGSGAFTSNESLGPFAGYALEDAGTTTGTVRLSLQSIDGQAAVARSALVQDDAALYNIPLADWLDTATGAKLGASAGTPSGAFGLTYGTHGSAGPKILSEAASGNTKTNKMRRTFMLPPEYVAGQTVVLRVRCAETVAAAAVSTTIDAEVFKLDKDGGIGSDICATSLADVDGATAANKDFTITPTGLVPGDVLDIELTGVVTDTGETNGTVLEIYATELHLDIKG